MPADLRSDTVTKPTPAMRRAMAEAEVGDDQYGEDPTVRRLEEAFAERLGKEAALFVPSGTMANQVALRVLTRPGDAVIGGARQHIVAYEDGAGPLNAGVIFLTVPDDDGTLDPQAVALAAQGHLAHLPRATLLAIEDTHMAAGGAPWPLERLRAVGQAAGAASLAVHLDGARLWHAEVATGIDVSVLAEAATTVTCCLSKGLAAPVGSVLAGSAETMAGARRERHRLGGAMRQAGVLAAAGLVALDQMVGRLADDHARATRLAEAVAQRWPDIGFDAAAVRTNVVIFRPPDAAGLLAHLDSEGVRAGLVAPGTVRLVTHADVDDAGIDLAVKTLQTAPV
ncbi:MAG: beta-eliminating lyase-related protein [Acidimicrobiaceae bacterium]|nr:beta-eliminating lyase-related protein [Acidimicrobiaceae bacterium]